MAENYFGLTDVGRVRENNEDAFIAEKVGNKNAVLACVIDGVGGYVGGEVAAALAKEVILDYCQKPSARPVSMLKEALIAANEKIYTEKQRKQEYSHMACVATLVWADVQRNQFYYAHVGDTRLYLLRDETLVKVSKDQSFVGFLEDTGRLTENAAMTHPRRNEIDKALGFDAHIIASTDYIEIGESPFLPGDLLLLCSDGLTDMITRDQIISVLTRYKTLQEKGQTLIEAANTAGGNDNITVVLVQNNKRAVKQKAIQPATTSIKNENKIEEPMEEQSSPVVSPVQHLPSARSNRGLIILLSFLCCLFLGSFLWMLWKSNAAQNAQDTALPVGLNPHEKWLSDTINNLQGNTLVISDSSFANEITISDTIFIQRDSLHLKGSTNTILIRDSAYNGPALMLSKDCRYVLLENITLKYFDIGILAQSRVLRLKNVLFENCHIPLQYQFLFPDNEVINGTIVDTALFTSQSFK